MCFRSSQQQPSKRKRENASEDDSGNSMASPLQRQRSDVSLEVLGTILLLQKKRGEKKRKVKASLRTDRLYVHLSHRISFIANSTRSVVIPMEECALN